MTRILPALAILFVCLVLVACRWPALNFPLFWDELGVYGPSVFYLLENGVDFQPKSLDPELSRGHPMLYVYVNALVGSVFGATGVVLHAFNLLIACLVLLGTFALGKKVLGTAIGVLAAAILSVQPIFHAQATLILPEMALALAALGMLYAYLTRMPWMYLVSGVAAVWLKETAIFIPLALIMHRLLTLRLRRVPVAQVGTLLEVLLLSLPWVAFGAFLLLQKVQNGWFLFPYHTGLFDFSPLEVLKKFGRFLKFLLLDQGRFVWSAVLSISLILAVKKKQLSWRKWLDHPYSELYTAFFLFGFLLVGFSATNAYLNRYLLLLFPPLALVVAAQLYSICQTLLMGWPASRRGWVIPTFLLLGFLFLGLPWIIPVRKFVYDEHPFFERHLILTQMAVQEMMENEEYQDCHVQCNWPIHTALEDKEAGYRQTELPFYLLGPNDTLDYQVRLDPGSYSYPPPPNRSEVFKIIEYHGMTCTIYRRK